MQLVQRGTSACSILNMQGSTKACRQLLLAVPMELQSSCWRIGPTCKGAHEARKVGQARLGLQAGQPNIANFGHALAGQQHVAGLHILRSRGRKALCQR